MKKLFVIFGGVGFLVISFIILVGLEEIPQNYFMNNYSYQSYTKYMLFLGCLWVFALAAFIGGLANSEIEG